MESQIIQEEFLDYINKGFYPVITEDGSFSLRQGEGAEPMHSLMGALEESLFIYGEALDLFMDNIEGEFEVLSVGLGFGYNEIITAHKLKEFKGYKLKSFESERELEDLFTKRLKEPEKYPLYWKSFRENKLSNIEFYDSCLFEVLEHKGPLTIEKVEGFESKKRVVLFDAYSSKTTQSLWTKDFLEALLSKCENGSVFSTYAAKGVLNRALKKNGFKNLKKDGFCFKRQSTLAIK